MAARSWWAWALLLALGCSSTASDPASETGQPPGEVPDARATTDARGGETDTAESDGDVDAEEPTHTDGGTGTDVPAEPAPAAPESEPEPLAVESWLVGFPVGTDHVISDLARGRFEAPEPGTDEHGTAWIERETGEGGRLGAFGQQIGYAVATVHLDEGKRLFARADRVTDVFCNGVRQPGDPYGSGKMRVPLAAQPGDNLLVVRAYGRRGQPSLELFTTEHELWPNPHDLTLPDVIAGEQRDYYAGVPVLNLGDAPVADLKARVLGDGRFDDTTVSYPGIAPGAVTQVAFLLRMLQPAPPAGEEVKVLLRLESPSLEWSYEHELVLESISGADPYRRTFHSPIDASVQYYGVRPPKDFDPERSYGLVLSLHGAGVEAINQARSYSPKDWTYVVAPTNRRPFGFDWEEWGRLNAIAALDDASTAFDIDPTKVYLSGHSMGGHGTWHVGVTTPGRFAVIGPSAGWESFYTYGGSPVPGGPFARSRAHSQTREYLSNLARRGVYVIHGSADDNVPVREGRTMVEAVRKHCDDVVYHEEEGAGHWWDGDVAEGTDCVDWPELFAFMKERPLDPLELDFAFKTPSPSYSPTHSFVTLHSATSPYADLVVRSERDGSRVRITTDNVRSMELDGAALKGLGVDEVIVDGEARAVDGAPIQVGPSEGKSPGRQGPYNQVYRRPFCFVVADGAEAMMRHASFLVSTWAIIGNGHACTLPYSALNEQIRQERNLIYVGVPRSDVDLGDIPISWDEESVTVDGARYVGVALLAVFPEGERLSAILTAPPGFEHLLYHLVPFSSRDGLPDYVVISDAGLVRAGFMAPDWSFDPSLGVAP